MTAYAELAVTTNFSFLRGASHPQEMVARADELGLTAIGIADRNTFAGVVRAYDEARKEKTSSFSSARASSPSTVSRCSPIRRIAQAYGRLCRLLTTGQSQGQERRMPSDLRGDSRRQRRPDFYRAAAASTARLARKRVAHGNGENDAFTARLSALARAAPGRTFLAGVHYHRGDEPRRLGLLAELGDQRRCAARRRQ